MNDNVLEHPEFIGPYRILDVLGEGGIGVVYLAEQAAPVRRRVALKVIKLGMDTRQVVARFASERQALAVMDHPNIATVFDGGATDGGRPYFVMEWVKGVPITDYCDTYRLTTIARVQLFCDVCAAIQHAHQKGVIHRDLKPSNILVGVAEGGDPQVRVIDFGIAKAVSPTLTDASLVTQQGQFIGTPAYMSPEQAEMSKLDVDTRSDIYSLGVILYELLVGALPIEVGGMASYAVQHALRETEPAMPSNRFDTHDNTMDTLAESRGATPAMLRRELRGDLDWIVLKAIAKDRTRRYDGVSLLAADLQRHLAHEPVLARPPSAWYRLSRFVRRNQLSVTAGAAVVLAMIVGTGAATVGLLRANEAQRAATAAVQVAEAEALRANEVSDFLVDLFEDVDPDNSRGMEVTAREVLDRGVQRIRTGLEDQPAMRARLLDTMGEVHKHLALYPRAESLMLEAVQVRRDVGAPAVDLAGGLIRLGGLYFVSGQYEKSETALNEALSLVEQDGESRERFALALGDGLNSLGLIMARPERAEYARAELLYREAQRLIQLGGEQHEEDVDIIDSNVAAIMRRMHRYDEAAVVLEDLHARSVRRVGARHPTTAIFRHLLGSALADTGDMDNALAHLQAALESQQKVFGDVHAWVAASHGKLGELYLHQSDIPHALAAMARARQVTEEVYPSPHYRRALASSRHGMANLLNGDVAAADAAMKGAAAEYQATGGHAFAISNTVWHADVALSASAPADALAALAPVTAQLAGVDQLLAQTLQAIAKQHQTPGADSAALDTALLQIVQRIDTVTMRDLYARIVIARIAYWCEQSDAGTAVAALAERSG